MSKITETNAQYYQGAQGFREDGVFNGEYPTTFDVNLEFYSSDPADENYARIILKYILVLQVCPEHM